MEKILSDKATRPNIFIRNQEMESLSTHQVFKTKITISRVGALSKEQGTIFSRAEISPMMMLAVYACMDVESFPF